MKTPDQVKEEFKKQGITTVQWAKDHGFPLYAVYRVLCGINKCHRGQAHEIAVALGIKEPAKKAA